LKSIKLISTVTMSNNAELFSNSNDLNKPKELIKYYEFEQFYNLKIGTGSFGKVYHANWKNSHGRYAIKSFFNIDDAAVKAIVHEVIIILNIFH
jgi:hypothetical protein